MKRIIPLILLAACNLAVAETPSQVAATYATQQGGGFKPSAQRGAELYKRQFAISAKMPSCFSCHTDQPTKPGQHAVTGKDIKPLAPAGNAERFTDPAKVEKWFKRNCKEVVGRECSAGEKADFIAYLTEVR